MIKEFKKVILLVEGVQVPVLAVTCSAAVNTFTTCSFSIPVGKKGKLLPYRSHVGVFASKYSDCSSGNMQLLFDGEIVAAGISATGSSIACNYTAMGFYHHLRQRTISFGNMDGNNANLSDDVMSSGINSFSPVGLQTNFFSIAMDRGGNKDIDIAKGLETIMNGQYTNIDIALAGKEAEQRSRVEKFFKVVGESKKLTPELNRDRFYFQTAPTLNQLAGYKAGEATNTFHNQLANDLTGKMSRWDVLMRLIGLFNYDIVMPLGCIGKSFIAKPGLMFNVPPKCNVIFPTDLISMSYSDSFTSKITRTFSSFAGGAPSNVGNGHYYNWSPKIINENIMMLHGSDEAKQKYIADKKSYDSYSETANVDLSSEMWESEWEKHYGTNTGYTTLYSPYILCASIQAAIASNDNTKSAPDASDYLGIQELVQNYERLKAFHGSASMNFTCKYSPNLTPGFPILVIKDYAYSDDAYVAIIGYLVSVNHYINPQGGFSSNGVVQFARVVGGDVPKDASLKLTDGLPWLGAKSSEFSSFNNAFTASNIGNGLYSQALGSSSAVSSADEEKYAAAMYDEFKSLKSDEERYDLSVEYSENRSKEYKDDFDSLYSNSYRDTSDVESYISSLGIKSEKDYDKDVLKVR